ncbi:FAD-linked oxidoreductase sorD [Colletotrichum orbiculare MAFF 240422]|uniref:FAD-linked oxidoreductase sorD n=1 Tax=Colletotrichum orbiculare (strain 104-T / ATCC 96160 / CBS 514.97 / LARS 414 / MAFF 240422) TaxID=1213857 RepID=A0A484FH76_COLOR|nr:FAD-linked oxidoreductase sorD [Colletotrichum orbiculare MAFF 240422]
MTRDPEAASGRLWRVRGRSCPPIQRSDFAFHIKLREASKILDITSSPTVVSSSSSAMAPIQSNWATTLPGQQARRPASWGFLTSISAAAFVTQYFLAPGPLVQPPSLKSCLLDVCDGQPGCVQFPGEETSDWLQPFNLGQVSVPAAIIRPKNAQEIASIVNCAATHGSKVQAKAGGHSFANHGFGGEDGAVSVDMHNFRYVTVDSADLTARVGGGTSLRQLDDQLRPFHRGIPHGVCHGIGIGGHATIGGFGPMSRMWGTTLDHVEEVEVVTANGTIVRASNHHNTDLFFAIRGAGAGFGIVTEFKMRTRSIPREVLHLDLTFDFEQSTDLTKEFIKWQKLAADRTLDHRFGTEFTVTPLGVLKKLSYQVAIISSRESWETSLARRESEESLHIPNHPSKLLLKGLGFTQEDVLAGDQIADLFEYLKVKSQLSTSWSIKFTASGGAVADVPMAATAFAHRDKLMFYQSYSVDDSRETRSVLDGFHEKLLNLVHDEHQSTYPGFSDPELRNPQRAYWGSNLPALEQIKASWDPSDIFHHPQSSQDF